MKSWRSIEFRLAAWFSLLLLAGLTSLGAVLWFGVNYSMVAAVDDLLAARLNGLVDFVDAEFGSEFPESPAEHDGGELQGAIDGVDHRQESFWVAGTKIHFRPGTVFESETGTFVSSELKKGQYVEVTVARQNDKWFATKISLERGLPRELQEELHEYALGIPEGNLIRIQGADGRPMLPSSPHADGQPPVPWHVLAAEERTFQTVEAEDGLFRILADRVSLAGDSYNIQLAAPLASVVATRKRLISWALWAIPIGVLLSFSGGLAISRAALRPVERVVNLASHMDVNRLSERLEVPATGDVVQQLAETFNEMLSRLEGSVKRLEEFTADASHELRSPVSVIRTTAELALRQAGSAEDLRRDMREIHEEAARLTELIEDLLVLARADSGGEQIPRTQVELAPLVSEVGERYRTSAGGRKLDVEVEPRDVTVHGHGPSLRRLLTILLDNAVRHTPADASIHVSVCGNHDKVILSVADSGEGIPPDDVKRVFDRFYRADPARNRSQGGFGLGLAIAKWITESHGGVITVSSEVGKGSTFQVRLPRADSTDVAKSET